MPAPAIAADKISEDPGEAWKRVQPLPCQLTVDLPVPGFKVRDLLTLGPQSVVDSRWRAGQDVPLRVNAELIGWCGFEVIGEHLAVRISELA